MNYTDNAKAICPDCGKEHNIHPLSHYYIKRGMYKGYCRTCHSARVTKAVKKTHYINCPKCGDRRIVSNTVMCDFKKGKRKGYCEKCTEIVRKTNKNSGQYVKGCISKTKGINPNMKEDQRIYKLKWREANRDKVNKYFLAYYYEHLEISKMTRRISGLKRRAMGNISIDTIKVLQDKYPYCYICGGILVKWEIEHIIPISLGGDNNINNLALACMHCNRTKSNKTLEQYKKDRCFTGSLSAGVVNNLY